MNRQIKAKQGKLTNEIIESVQNQDIFWSDDRNEHYFFDFKFKDRWVSSVKINNELTEILININ